MKARSLKIILTAGALLLLILDNETAVEGIRSGIDVCLQSAIPSLLPFFVLTKYLSAQLYGIPMPIFSKLGNKCGIPQSMESIWCIGLIGGYPMGAQLIGDAWSKGYIDKHTAARMLGFCNNCGPAFIFGVCSSMFTNKIYGLMILCIQIISSLLCGIILPGKKVGISPKISSSPLSFTEYFVSAIRAMGYVSGWIVFFRMIIAYMKAYITIKDPVVQVMIYGFLELTNGCLRLSDVHAEAIRFVLMNMLLSFGGLCVWLQTVSVINEVPLKWFFLGKTLQAFFSVILSSIIVRLIGTETGIEPGYGSIIICAAVITSILCWKKVVAFRGKVLYNKKKNGNKRYSYAVSQKD